MHHVRRAAEMTFEEPAAYAAHAPGHRRAQLVGGHVGAVHTGFALCDLAARGAVGTHLHSYEESFYVLEGRPQLTLDGRSWQLAADDCGLVPVGVPHAWRAPDGDARWIEVSAPTPRRSGPPDTFFTGDEAPVRTPEPLDIRDPRSRTFFRLGEGQMDLDNLKIGAPVD